MALSDVGSSLARSLVEQSGSRYVYRRGTQTETIMLFRSDLPPTVFDSGNGTITEVTNVSFRGLFSDFACFSEPMAGDRIVCDSATYEAQPLTDKCYYTIGGMVHINAVRVSQ